MDIGSKPSRLAVYKPLLDRLDADALTPIVHFLLDCADEARRLARSS